MAWAKKEGQGKHAHLSDIWFNNVISWQKERWKLQDSEAF